MEQTKLDAAVQSQLAQIDQSLYYIRRILAGISLSYAATWQQRQRLLDAAAGVPEACQPDPLPLQTGSSLLILSALFFFTGQSRRILQAAGPAERCSAEIGLAGNQLVLAVALARLADLLRINCASQTSPATQAAENEDVDLAAI